MNTLIVYYSKTGNTRTVAEAVIKKLGCDFDEIIYDEKSETIRYSKNPADYGRIILLAPVWAFSLAEPMKKYIRETNAAVKKYDLIVTCGLFGLGGCVKNCTKAFGKAPDNALIFKAKKVKLGDFDISAIK